MLHLIGIGVRTGTSLRRKIVDSIALAAIGLMAIIGILTFASCGQDEPMKLMAVCTETPAKTVSCTWIPLEEKHRTETEQELFDTNINWRFE